MDKEQAKFILRSFRPGEADLNAEDFAEALALAASNRELGEWLAEERAMDEAFTKALGSIELPGTLREDILGCLEGERRDYPNAEDSDDAAMIGALASMPVPANLRGDILAAMERSVPREADKTEEPTEELKQEVAAQESADSKVVPFWRRLSMPLAAAAGIALALFLTRGSLDSGVPIESVPVSFISTYESPDFALEVTKTNHKDLVNVLESKSLPCPCALPPGLEGRKSIGCRELVIDGKQGSLICFLSDNMGVVHLVIFDRDDVDGSCANLIADPCYLEEKDWSIARWQSKKNVFFLIGKGGEEELKKLF